MGVVKAVCISEKTGTVKVPVPEIVVDSRGVVGDAHAGEWHRQVSLLSWEYITEYSQRAGKKVSPGEFAENITTEGIDLSKVALLDRFVCGQVLLEVTQIGKKDHEIEGSVLLLPQDSIMPKVGIFTRVLSGGVIRPGTLIEHRERPLRVAVITLSDRASKGEYKDLSGPAIRAQAEEFLGKGRWHPQFSSALLPDDPHMLEKELRKLIKSGVDVVFTTGGTGIGPRDFTPDVVSRLAEKLIPGIMEHIRLKYGATNPNALLSRSVGAVAGNTLIYTLPGSVKAVQEYLDEILPTLEHTLKMVHGLGH